MPDDLERAALACAEAQNLNDAGLALLHQRDFDGAFLKLTAGLHLLEGHPQSLPLMNAKGALSGNLAQVYLQRGQLDDAIKLLKEQVALAVVTKDLQSLSNALNGLAICYTNKGDLDQAQSLCEQRLKIARQIGDQKGEGNTLNNLSQIYIERRQFGPATALLRQRVELARKIGDKRGEASSLVNLGMLYQETRQLDSAKTVLRDALKIMSAEGDPRITQAQQLLAAVEQQNG
jgi:tetratricopeptide (TPR) repeat protein